LLKQAFLLSDWSIDLEKFTVRQHGECGVSFMKESFFFTFLFRPSIVQRYIEETEILASSIVFTAVGRSENPGVPVLFGGHNLPPQVEIGLTDLPKSGGGTPGTHRGDTPGVHCIGDSHA
jgi:hypothetical protein